jgi:DMSO reductase anchor subunit
MRPALSVVFFTASSGAGLGLLVWLLGAQLAGATDASRPDFRAAAVLAALLVTAGLLSSTLHLANPRNAWRSFARFRTSWLSREGVLAVALYPLAALHLWLGQRASPAVPLTAAALAALALATVVCTAMIYACLKTVPRWRTWHTPAGYLLVALAGGGLLWRAVGSTWGDGAPPSAGVPIGLVVAAGLVKAAFYAKFSRRVHATLNEALAVPETAPPGHVQGRVRLLDAGHSHGTFLTHEFGFELARERAGALRATMFALTLGAPLALAALGAGPLAAWAAAACFLAGVLVERWLFFAQAEHVVRLYHGQQRV